MPTSDLVGAVPTAAFARLSGTDELDKSGIDASKLDKLEPGFTGIFAEVRFKDSQYAISFRTHSQYNETNTIPLENSIFVGSSWEIPIGQIFVDLANLTELDMGEYFKSGKFQNDLLGMDSLQKVVHHFKCMLTAAYPSDILRRFMMLEIERRLVLRGINDSMNIVREVISDTELLSKGAREYLSVYVEDGDKARKHLGFLLEKESSDDSLRGVTRLRMIPEYHPTRGVGYYVRIRSIRDLLMYELANPEIKPPTIKCCENCHKYFIANRRDVLFCSNDSPYAEDRGHPCNVVGPQKRTRRKKLRQEVARTFSKYKTVLRSKLVELQYVDTDEAIRDCKMLDTELRQVRNAEEKLYSLIESDKLSKPELDRFIKDKAWRHIQEDDTISGAHKN